MHPQSGSAFGVIFGRHRRMTSLSGYGTPYHRTPAHRTMPPPTYRHRVQRALWVPLGAFRASTASLVIR